MVSLIEMWESVRDFVGTGGDVLYIVALVLFIMWAFMIERYVYFTQAFPKYRDEVIKKWHEREDTTSWYAHKIRDFWISEASGRLDTGMLLIKTLVAMCPLVGLLGTVTGMIAVFEVMAFQGTGNPRLMAEGISMATIPTMSGMVAAISGVFFSSRLESKAKYLRESLVDSMPHH
jgi:biopolymer transport protein ExbB